MTGTAIIVPARLDSSRFPQKLLHEVRGKPVLLWTAERIRDQAGEYPLYFAVDGQRLGTLLQAAGFTVVLTDPALPSGTDRIARANEMIGAERVINVQGDEPLVTGAQIRLLDSLLTAGVDMATLAAPFGSRRDFEDQNHVKVVLSRGGRALYFSRAPIPLERDAPAEAVPREALVHLGLYAYTGRFLRVFASLPSGPLELAERLEMLRALENGYHIAVGVTRETLIEIDTPDNVAQFEAALASGSLAH